MRHRLVFAAGVGLGFVLGTRAGRERYEQMRGLARKAADSPVVQSATDAVQAQAAGLARAARDKLADQAGVTRARVEDALAERVPGMRARDSNGRSHGGGHGEFDARSGVPVDPQES